MVERLLRTLQWGLSSALALLRMRQFSLVRGFVSWALKLAPGLRHARVGEQRGCALVCDILHKRKLPVSLASATDFILGPPTAHPAEYVLADTVSLYCLTEAEAIFVEVPAACDVYAGSRAPSPFLFDTQFELAVRVVRLPLEVMLRLASQVELEASRLIILSNTTRCGSMLLCDMLEAAPRVRVLREPDALTCVLLLQHVSLDAQRAILRGALRMLCKPAAAAARTAAIGRGGDGRGAGGGAPVAGGAPHAIVAIKPRGHCIKLLKLMADAVPGCRHLFLYRDGLLTAQSMARAFCSEPVHLTRHWLLQSPMVRRLFPADAAMAKALIVISDDPLLEWARAEDYFTALPPLAKYALLWAVVCRTYLLARADGLLIAACRLDDLDRDRDRFCREVFEWCGIDAAHAALAARASAHAGDAHQASIFSRSRLAHFRAPTVDSAELRRTLDEICDNCGVPRLGEPTLLPGTLGHPADEAGKSAALAPESALAWHRQGEALQSHSQAQAGGLALRRETS
ncbi:hypothetical protein KFE25_005522 [Diacronema lutheri]|uniref:Sulfotransferase n=1 Tax=Diacronema lutheri TaxID=2081491 RepID=A0A8J6C8Z9_DIALT|nr:hypothetical protein KFE25_005522 [Diacronema lutheri]